MRIQQIGILLLSLCVSTELWAQSVTLQAHVVDKAGTPLFAVNLYLKQHAQVGVITDPEGYFQLVLNSEKEQNDTLVVSFVGYRTILFPLHGKQKLPPTIVLEEENYVLADTYIIASPSTTREFSVKELKVLDIYNDPRASADALKVVTSHPASTNTTEGAEPELRGSTGAFSRVVFNNVPIYHPVRNAELDGTGAFSLFSTEFIDRQNTYASNAPLAFTNALAGAVEIQTKRELSARNTSVVASLATASILHSQPLGSYSFVQLYANYMYSPAFLTLNAKTEDLHRFGSLDGAINAHTMLGKRVALNLYAYAIDEHYAVQSYTYGYQGEMRYRNKRNFNVLNIEARFGELFWLTNVGYDHAKTHYQLGNTDLHELPLNCYASTVLKYNPSWLSLEAGLIFTDEQTRQHGVFPKFYFAQRPEAPTVARDTNAFFRSLESYLYLKHRFAKKVTLGVGGRLQLPSFEQPFRISAQANAKYAFLAYHALLLSVGQYWGHTTPQYNVWEYRPAQSQQLALDYVYHYNEFELQSALYYKQETTTTFEATDYRAESIVRRIAGGELSVSKQLGSFYISAAYTYLWARVRIRDNWYNALNQMNYLVKGLVSYTNPTWGKFSLALLTHPGLAYTPIIGGFSTPEQTIPLWGEYGAAHYNAYQTIDFSYNKVWFLNERSMLILFASVRNILDRQNQNRALYAPDYSQRTDWRHYGRRVFYLGVSYSF